MTRHLLATTFLTVLVLLVLNNQPAAKDKKDPKAATPGDYYPLQVGNVWTYQVTVDGKKGGTTAQVASVELVNGQTLAVLESAKPKLSEHLSQSDKGVFRHRLNGADVSPPFCVLKYPATVGAKWDGEFAVGKDSAKERYVAEIQKEDDVAVPAGKFKALRVHVELQEKGQTVKTTYWFAKDVGIVKQAFDAGPISVMLELTKLDRKK